MAETQERPLAVHDGLFELDGDGGLTLIGGWSASARRHHFPLRPRCPYTGADDVEAVELPRTGTLWLWTAVTAAPAGYAGAVPYGMGIVALDGIDLRVVSRLTEPDPGELHEGQPMRLVADHIGAERGQPVVTWAFAVARS